METQSHGHYRLIFLLWALVFQHFEAVSSTGVVYNGAADDLPPHSEVAIFLKDRTTIDRVKIPNANTDIIKAFANTGIALTITVPNAQITKIVDPAAADQWVSANVKPFLPQTKIGCIDVGSQVLWMPDSDAKYSLVGAMTNLHQALRRAGINHVKVSTPHAISSIINIGSNPPSAARFNHQAAAVVLLPLLKFLRETKSPFKVNIISFFVYKSKDEDMMLFRPKDGVRDPATSVTYTNSFDMMMDSVFSALKSVGYQDLEIVVGSTGWPSQCDPGSARCSIENARAHNLNVLQKVSSGAGTPLMPNRKFETYLYELFNENLKTTTAEKNFGLFHPDFTPVYEIGLLRGPPKNCPGP